MKNIKLYFALLLFTGLVNNCHAQTSYTLSSPDKSIRVTCDIGKVAYMISYKGQPVMKESKLGVIRDDEDFSKDLKVIKASAPTVVRDSYTMVNAKKKNINYVATQRIIETQTALGKKMNIVFRVSNDGVALRYEFPGKSTDVKKITAEATSFHWLYCQLFCCWLNYVWCRT